MITVIDNFLSKNDHEHIKHALLGNTPFPWFYNDHKMSVHKEDVYDMQFVHIFYKDYGPQSEYFELIRPFLYVQRPTTLLRVKANLTPATHEIYQYGMHTDVEPSELPIKTAVYYVNSNNGATVFETGDKVESVANRFVMFDANMRHAGTSCTDAKCRCVINFNFM